MNKNIVYCLLSIVYECFKICTGIIMSMFAAGKQVEGCGGGDGSTLWQS